jgi:hypothetical protein
MATNFIGNLFLDLLFLEPILRILSSPLNRFKVGLGCAGWEW